MALVEESVQVVLKAWARKQTGILSCSEVPGGAVLFEGEPLTSEALDYAMVCIESRGVSFIPTELRFEAQAPPLSRALWKRFEQEADGARLKGPDVALKDTPLTEFAGRLPIHPDTRRMLGVPRDGTQPLAWDFDLDDIDPEVVRSDLSALVVAGFFELKRVSESRTDRGELGKNVFVAEEKVHMEACKAELLEMRRTNATRGNVVLEQLQREWSLVRQCDEWYAVGVTSSDPPERVEASCARLEDRYEKLQFDFSLPSEARELMQKMHMKHIGSVNLVRRAMKNRGLFNKAQESYQEGMRQLGAGNFSVAVRLLAAARKANPMNPLILANLGWAIYHDSSQPEHERLDIGRQMVADADAIADNMAEPAMMLARIDLREGMLKQAEQRLRALLRKDQANAEARQLLHEVQQARDGA
jgi:hypothetical protein